MTISAITTVRTLATTVRDDLRERREARAKLNALRQELSSYRTANEIDDLLGSIRDQDGPEAQQIRDVLLSNLASTYTATPLYRIA
jgi:hypothetical protein